MKKKGKSEIERLIELLKSRINDENCFEFSNNIDGCKIRARGYKLKIRFDGCANKYFNVDGGCDCIFVFSNKVCIVVVLRYST
jgi:hypothetical protein